MLDGVMRRFADASPALLERQIAIAAIAAPTGGEGRRAEALAKWLSNVRGCDVRRDAAGNVIARLAGRERADDDRAPVVVLAHLDTVFEDVPQPSARREGSRVVMPGIGDNGRGLVALLALADALTTEEVRARRRRPIELVATVGEEGAGNLRGARAYFDDRDAAHQQAPVAVIAVDGPGDALIVHHSIASRRVRVSYRGDGGHPWADAGAANAVHAAGCAIAAVTRLAGAQRSGATVTVTRMGGGESLTSIPAQAWFDVDLRALDASELPRLHCAVCRLAERAIADAARPHAPRALTVSFDLLGDRPGGSLDRAHPLVQLAFDATRWQAREPQSASASTDANIPLSRGIPAITIGAGGSGGGAHTAHEWYDDADGARGLARALAVVAGCAGDGHELAAS